MRAICLRHKEHSRRRPSCFSAPRLLLEQTPSVPYELHSSQEVFLSGSSLSPFGEPVWKAQKTCLQISDKCHSHYKNGYSHTPLKNRSGHKCGTHSFGASFSKQITLQTSNIYFVGMVSAKTRGTRALRVPL